LKRVRELIRTVGEVKYHLFPKSEKTMYIIFPVIIGRLLEQWGMPIGDKALQEVRIPSYIMMGPTHLKRIYFSEMIPEDGSFSKKPRNEGLFEWSRSVVLFDFVKGEKYGFVQKLSFNEIEFIRKHGKETTLFGSESVIRLKWNYLKELVASNDIEIAATAGKIIQIVYENPPSILEDEIILAESLGINLSQWISKINFFQRTKRVSVQWSISTSNRKNTIRFGILAPPNSEEKNTAFESWLNNLPKKIVKDVITEIQKEGYKID
jgi:hypothetical protein